MCVLLDLFQHDINSKYISIIKLTSTFLAIETGKGMLRGLQSEIHGVPKRNCFWWRKIDTSKIYIRELVAKYFKNELLHYYNHPKLVVTNFQTRTMVLSDIITNIVMKWHLDFGSFIFCSMWVGAPTFVWCIMFFIHTCISALWAIKRFHIKFLHTNVIKCLAM